MNKVFEYVAIYRPTQKEREDGTRDEIVVPLTRVLARDENAATLAAARAIPEDYVEKLDQVEVAVRAF